MQLDDFYYDLPKELIARYPLKERSASRLLCLNKNSSDITHQQFKNLPDFLATGDLLVLNNTRVMPARLYGKKSTGGQVEILIERLINKNQAYALLNASKAPKMGSIINLEGAVCIEVLARKDNLYHILFHGQQTIHEIIDQQGHIPLPPYIERKDELVDRKRYQTVFAEQMGSIAAPTAGLHFDNNLFKVLSGKGVQIAFITLHVGLGTFQPVRIVDIKKHVMHSEFVTISQTVCEQINKVKETGNRVIAVGTTTARALETAASNGKVEPYNGDTNLFIYPGFNFQCIDALITNFHLPASTLLMLVCAFAGYPQTMQAYQTAIKERYRFYSYGDAMFIY